MSESEELEQTVLGIVKQTIEQVSKQSTRVRNKPPESHGCNTLLTYTKIDEQLQTLGMALKQFAKERFL